MQMQVDMLLNFSSGVSGGNVDRPQLTALFMQHETTASLRLLDTYEITATSAAAPAVESDAVVDVATPYALPFSVALALIFLGGLLLNATAALSIMLRRAAAFTPSAALMLNLAVADLVYACSIPMFISQTMGVAWHFGELGCQLFVFADFVGTIVCAYTVAALVIERYLEMSDHSDDQHHYQHSHPQPQPLPRQHPREHAPQRHSGSAVVAPLARHAKLACSFAYMLLIWLFAVAFQTPMLLSTRLERTTEPHSCHNAGMIENTINTFLVIKYLFLFVLPHGVVVLVAGKLLCVLNQRRLHMRLRAFSIWSEHTTPSNQHQQPPLINQSTTSAVVDVAVASASSSAQFATAASTVAVAFGPNLAGSVTNIKTPMAPKPRRAASMRSRTTRSSTGSVRRHVLLSDEQRRRPPLFKGNNVGGGGGGGHASDSLPNKLVESASLMVVANSLPMLDSSVSSSSKSAFVVNKAASAAAGSGVSAGDDAASLALSVRRNSRVAIEPAQLIDEELSVADFLVRLRLNSDQPSVFIDEIFNAETDADQIERAHDPEIISMAPANSHSLVCIEVITNDSNKYNNNNNNNSSSCNNNEQATLSPPPPSPLTQPEQLNGRASIRRGIKLGRQPTLMRMASRGTNLSTLTSLTATCPRLVSYYDFAAFALTACCCCGCGCCCCCCCGEGSSSSTNQSADELDGSSSTANAAFGGSGVRDRERTTSSGGMSCALSSRRCTMQSSTNQPPQQQQQQTLQQPHQGWHGLSLQHFTRAELNACRLALAVVFFFLVQWTPMWLFQLSIIYVTEPAENAQVINLITSTVSYSSVLVTPLVFLCNAHGSLVGRTRRAFLARFGLAHSRGSGSFGYELGLERRFTKLFSRQRTTPSTAVAAAEGATEPNETLLAAPNTTGNQTAGIDPDGHGSALPSASIRKSSQNKRKSLSDGNINALLNFTEV